MSVNNSQVGDFGVELTETMTGSTILIGTLTAQPTHIIFDNLSNVAIQIYVNQTTDVWKTFPAGRVVELNLRSANGLAPNFTFPTGTTFYGNGASGDFSISYIYARNV
jgi:hypothetical protein